MEVFEVSTKIRSSVECSDQVCCGKLCSIVRIEFTNVWGTMGFGDLSSPSGRSNSFVVSRDMFFSEDMLVVIA